MKLIRFASASLLLLAACATASLAQAQRTFVSGLGSDSNPCSRTAPCRTFGQAISQTNAGGEVYVLDTAGYGAFTINKSVSIIAPPGVTAGISVFSGDGIGINVASSDVVNLRGLTINGQGGRKGIAFNTGGTLRVESCVVRGFSTTNAGILLHGGNAEISDSVISDCLNGAIKLIGAGGNLLVTNTAMSDCLNGGVVIFPNSGTVNATMDHVTVEGSDEGIALLPGSGGGSATILAAIRDSTVSGANVGIIVSTIGGGGSAFLDVERCLVTNGGTGLAASQSPGSSAAMSISNCLISHNSTASFEVAQGAIIFTRGNNSSFGNGPPTGTLTPANAL